MRTRRPKATAQAARTRSNWTEPEFWVRCALVLAILVFSPGLLQPFEAPKAVVVRAIGLGALAVAIASARRLRGVRPQLLDLAVACWLVVEALSAAFSVAPRLSVLGDSEQHEGLFTSLGLAGLYVTSRLGTPNWQRVRTTLLVGVCAMVVACLYALMQVAGLDPFQWAGTAVYSGGYMRPFGTLPHPNVLGLVCAAAFVACIPALVVDRRSRLPLALAAAVLGAVMLLTLSRGAWLGASAGAIVAGALVILARAGERAETAPTPARRRPTPRIATIGAVVAAVAAGGALVALSPIGGVLRQRIAEPQTTGGSGQSRLEIWRTALATWRARPWLGHGPDTFALVFPRFQTPDYWRFEWAGLAAHAHSIYLHVLATRGAVGLAAGLWLVIALLLAARRAWQASLETRALLSSLLAAITALAIAGAFGALGISGAVLLTLAAAGVATLAERDTTGNRHAPPSKPGSHALLAGVVVAALALGLCSPDLLGSWFACQAKREWSSLADPVSAARAEAAANRAIAIDPWDDATACVRARTLFYLSKVSFAPQEALAAAEVSARRATRLAPLRAVGFEILGNVLMAKAIAGDAASRPAAEAAYARSFDLAPYNALAMLEYAHEELALRRPEAALALAGRAARLYPHTGLIQAMVAEASLAAGDSLGARRALRLAVGGEWPDDRDGHPWVGALLDSLDARGSPGR